MIRRLALLFTTIVVASSCARAEVVVDDQELATACSLGADSPPPQESDALTFVVSPSDLQAGESFSAEFDAQSLRGGYFLLSCWLGDRWAEPTFLLESDANGSTPTVQLLVDEPAAEILDYGIEGPGPDGLMLPASIEPGLWRLCTANSLNDLCVQLVVN